MSLIDIRELLAAGVHYGHKTQRWNPKMARYLYGSRNEIHIFDLRQTVRSLDEVSTFLWDLVRGGGSIVFVGTKRQARDAVREAANSCGQYYVMERWLGGTLTNFQTIKLRLGKLQELRALHEEGAFEGLSKRDARIQMIELDRLERKMGGIAGMSEIPQAVFVVDPKRESIAVKEAITLGIPVIGLVDSNCDPTGVDYVIPGNDDSIRSLNLILGRLSESLNIAFEQYEAERLEKEKKDRAERERQDRVRRESARKQAESKKSEAEVADPKNTKSTADVAPGAKDLSGQDGNKNGAMATSSTQQTHSTNSRVQDSDKKICDTKPAAKKVTKAKVKSQARGKAKGKSKTKAKTKSEAKRNSPPKSDAVKNEQSDVANQKEGQ